MSISGSETKFEVLSVAGRHWIGRSGRFSIKYFNLPFIKLFLLWESSHTIHRNTKTFSFVPGCLHCRHYMFKKTWRIFRKWIMGQFRKLDIEGKSECLNCDWIGKVAEQMVQALQIPQNPPQNQQCGGKGKYSKPKAAKYCAAIFGEHLNWDKYCAIFGKPLNWWLASSQPPWKGPGIAAVFFAKRSTHALLSYQGRLFFGYYM